ncbi:PAAR domain-containing protein [Pseudomonas alloputida]|uniref:PAAR domain-containing protein n=4 Tax=Pseudomonas TaxID=286 RepID=A0AAD2WEK2_PSEPU|nr:MULTISPECIES: PAAR domain-containing protein [Pseudomonas]EKT4503136.1 PAAR domain-containing protein [Pseudomonas putida]EKT4539087.1 PAAR domain-containing protein [Pseudomonas putida]EKT4569014.1 PAAR domain-containing protein [Pseudomonas putida]ELS0926441.1 PAAR domain-containing protein [Pseudomonas putida]ENY79404.1 hypothetical protein C206_02169 [Pseudomonas putida TRO1]
MSRKGAIRKGDPHSGGGRMGEGSGMVVNGRPQCILGDHAPCPLHGGTFALVSGGDRGVLCNGIALVFEPAELACGCRVSSTCSGPYAKDE